jgi:ribosomal-protein-alanine N-acetyltransferase
LLDLISVLTMPGVVRIKAEVGGEFAGFVAGDLRGPQNYAWIATIGVFPKFRGLGVGRALLEACEARLAGRVTRLCVRTDNHVAIVLYESRGYTRVDIWSKYYTDGSDALIMEKDLTNLEPQPTSQL